jgi:Tol biopolymer transport system component
MELARRSWCKEVVVRLFLLVSAAVVLLGSVEGSDASVPRSPARLAYSADGMIRVVDGDGSRPRVLARGESPSWNPEGTAIAFHSARVPGNGLDVYTMDADGTDQRRIVMHPGGGGEHPINTADDYGPAWSPTGWTIAFTTRRDGNDEIYSMDPIGHRVQRLTNSPAADRDPAWSPDGAVIAFVSDRDGNDEIYSLDQRRVLRRLTQSRGDDRAPAWSPDGRRIAFQSFRDGNWELYSMNADGNDPRRLTHGPEAETNPSWSRDGATIAFTGADASGRYLASMPAEADRRAA